MLWTLCADQVRGGTLWNRVEPCGTLWWGPLKKPSEETLWNPLEPSGTLWNPLAPSGTLWNPLAPSGTVWNQVGRGGRRGTRWDLGGTHQQRGAKLGGAARQNRRVLHCQVQLARVHRQQLVHHLLDSQTTARALLFLYAATGVSASSGYRLPSHQQLAHAGTGAGSQLLLGGLRACSSAARTVGIIVFAPPPGGVPDLGFCVSPLQALGPGLRPQAPAPPPPAGLPAGARDCCFLRSCGAP